MDVPTAIDLARKHPLVTAAVPNARAGLIDVTFTNAETVTVNIYVAAPSEGETQVDAEARFARMLTRMAETKVDDDVDITVALPLVRDVEYMRSGPTHVTHWLTDYIGVGLAIDAPETLHVVTTQMIESSGLDDEARAGLRIKAVTNLRQHKLELGAINLSDRGVDFGGGVLIAMGPYGHETAWMADIATMDSILTDLRDESGSEWVVVPSKREEFFVVDTAMRDWNSFLSLVEPAIDDRLGVCPLPHRLVDYRWVEWTPDDPQVRRRLAEMRFHVHGRAHQYQRDLLEDESEVFLANYSGVDLKPDGVASYSLVPATLEVTSVPTSDLLVFNDGDDFLGVRFDDVQRTLPHLFTPHEGTVPKRWLVRPPSAAGLETLRPMKVL